jgi:hypothetical protein
MSVGLAVVTPCQWVRRLSVYASGLGLCQSKSVDLRVVTVYQLVRPVSELSQRISELSQYVSG